VAGDPGAGLRLLDRQGEVMALLPAVGDPVAVAVMGRGGAGEDGEERERQGGERGGLELAHGVCLLSGMREGPLL